MKNRCLSPSNPSYSRYGGRGITVCERWLDFSNFLVDMGEKPAGTSIDRVDNDSGYYKENCRWATNVEQRSNTSRNVILTHNGISDTVKGWSRRIGLRHETLVRRLKLGWTTADALNMSVDLNVSKAHVKEYSLDGKTMSLAEWSAHTGITRGSIQGRINSGWSLEDALSVPTRKHKPRKKAET